MVSGEQCSSVSPCTSASNSSPQNHLPSASNSSPQSNPQNNPQNNQNNHQNNHPNHHPLLSSLQSFITLFSLPNLPPFTPRQVHDALALYRVFDPLLRKGRQEDAQEFLGLFLDVLGDEIGAPPPQSSLHQAEDSEEWTQVGQSSRSVKPSSGSNAVTCLFGGQTKSVLRCPGQRDSATLEPFLTLQMDIQSDFAHSVEECLSTISTPEVIPGVGQSLAEATKVVHVQKWPRVLILHLKRFVYEHSLDAPGGPGAKKVNKSIAFGETLVVPKNVVAMEYRETQISYRLFAVVNHHGQSIASGHYTTDVRRQDGECWFRIDDTSVEQISAAQVTVRSPATASPRDERNPYLLMYEKI